MEQGSDRDRRLTAGQALDHGLTDHVVASAAALPVVRGPVAAG